MALFCKSDEKVELVTCRRTTRSLPMIEGTGSSEISDSSDCKECFALLCFAGSCCCGLLVLYINELCTVFLSSRKFLNRFCWHLHTCTLSCQLWIWELPNTISQANISFSYFEKCYSPFHRYTLRLLHIRCRLFFSTTATEEKKNESSFIFFVIVFIRAPRRLIRPYLQMYIKHCLQ